MTDWQDIDSAPLDRPIVGINADGEESPMFSEKVHPKVDARFWCKGQDRSNPNWVKSECFYPVKWREPDAG